MINTSFLEVVGLISVVCWSLVYFSTHGKARKALVGCLVLLGCFFVVLGCEDEPKSGCFPGDRENITNYAVKPSDETPGGIHVDLRGLKKKDKKAVDLDKIDDIVLDTAVCIEELGTSVDLSCLKIKVVANWYPAYGGDYQLFFCEVPPMVCSDTIDEDGDIPKIELPCSCRGVIQDNDTVVIPPDLGLLRSELVKLFTGLEDPWVERLRPCVVSKLPE